MAAISAWAVGSLSRRTRFWPRATMAFRCMMIAPMGTSPDSAASRASARAACMSSSGLRIAYIVIARRLLLGHAVEGAEAPDEVNAVHADDMTAGKNLSENVESKPV